MQPGDRREPGDDGVSVMAIDRRAGRRGVAWASAALVAIAIAVGLLAGGVAVAMAMPAALGGAIGLAMLAPDRDARRRAVVGRGALLVDREAIPAAAIAGGLASPGRPGWHVVRLRRRDAAPDVVLEIGSAGDAARLLAALGLGAGQALAEFRLAPSPARAAGVITAAAWIGAAIAIAIGAPMPPWLAASVTVAALGLLLARRRVVLGADGLHLERARGGRFVRLAEVERVALDGPRLGFRCLRLGLVTGEAIALWLDDAPEGAPALAARVREALALGRGRAHAEATLVVLARRERDGRAWARALRAIGGGARATHRTAGVAHDDLAGVVEDPRADAEARAAAAVALAASSAPTTRARIAAVARSVAAPELRAALEAAADAREEAAVAEALDALSPARRRADA